MSGHGGGVSTALPRHGCVCRGCRARRFLPCHDLGQLVVSVGHGVPRVSVIPPEDSIFLLPPSRKSGLVFPRRFLEFPLLKSCTLKFVPWRHRRLLPTGRHHEAAHGPGGRGSCRISRACPSCLPVPRRAASCAHIFSPFLNACPGDHALLQPAARRPQARAARACTNLAMWPAV